MDPKGGAMNRRGTVALLAGIGWLAFVAAALAPPESPSQRYGALYAQVQDAHLFADSKTFADAEAREDPEAILAAWRKEKPQTESALRDFVSAHFDLPPEAGTPAAPMEKRSLRDHIAALWPMLTRPPMPASVRGSQLGFDHAHVVPG